jgi:hypothetical protein
VKIQEQEARIKTLEKRMDNLIAHFDLLEIGV